METTERLAAIFKALGDPNRLAIFRLLRSRCGVGCCTPADVAGTTVSQIADSFDLSLSTVSHHLKELRGVGLLRCQRRGQSIHCAPDDDPLRHIAEFLDAP